MYANCIGYSLETFIYYLNDKSIILVADFRNYMNGFRRIKNNNFLTETKHFFKRFISPFFA